MRGALAYRLCATPCSSLNRWTSLPSVLPSRCSWRCEVLNVSAIISDCRHVRVSLTSSTRSTPSWVTLVSCIRLFVHSLFVKILLQIFFTRMNESFLWPFRLLFKSSGASGSKLIWLELRVRTKKFENRSFGYSNSNQTGCLPGVVVWLVC